MDETGIDTCLHREYARSKRGTSVISAVSGKKFKRIGIVAAQMNKRIIAPMHYDGTMDSHLFELWFVNKLLPALPEDSVIVLDNASFHRKSKLYCLVENTGHRIIFLPPYSPELNPIEYFWSWLKRQLKKILPQHESFDEAVCSAFWCW